MRIEDMTNGQIEWNLKNLPFDYSKVIKSFREGYSDETKKFERALIAERAKRDLEFLSA